MKWIAVFLLCLITTACAAEENAVELTIYECITIPGILPGRVSYMDGLIGRDVRKKVELSQEEREKYDIRTEGKNILWNDDTHIKKVTFTKLEAKALKDALNKMDAKKELPSTDRFLVLYEKIMGLK